MANKTCGDCDYYVDDDEPYCSYMGHSKFWGLYTGKNMEACSEFIERDEEHENRTCGDCLYLQTADGEPYFCVVKDLYHFYEKTDAACGDFEERSDKDEQR